MKEKLEDITHEFLNDTPCFLVEVQESSDRIKVVLDGYNGVDIRLCSKLARHINRLSEEDESIGEFNIEVTSAGVGAEINTTNQLKSNVGRLVKVKEHNFNTTTGRLIAADNRKVCVIDVKEQIWYKKEDINSIKVEIEF